jgi:dTMP kinase
MLFAAARDDHVQQTILPALDAGKWVICDRFADSTRIYQGVLGSVDLRLIRALERVSIGDLKPDLTLVLDVPAEIGMKRAAGRRRGGTVDRFEAEDIAFHKKLREAYLGLAKAENDRCVIIDAKAPKKTAAQSIWEIVQEKFEPGRASAELRTAAS